MMLRVIACRLLDLPLLTVATDTATTAVATAGRVTTVLTMVRRAIVDRRDS